MRTTRSRARTTIFAAPMHERYRSLWPIIAQALIGSGDRERAATAMGYANRFGPAP